MQTASSMAYEKEQDALGLKLKNAKKVKVKKK
jgi:hypothetical protein